MTRTMCVVLAVLLAVLLLPITAAVLLAVVRCGGLARLLALLDR